MSELMASMLICDNSFAMDNESQPLITFSHMMSKVGSFLFYWSWLEQALTDSIVEMRVSLGDEPKAVKGELAKRLTVWTELLERTGSTEEQVGVSKTVVAQILAIKDVRNVIVHGLRAGDANSDTGAAFIECAIGGYENPTGSRVQYSMDDLENLTQGIDACRRAFIDLSYFNYVIDLPLS
ncbi:hypothetical protein [Parasphingorhabdus sp.]|uniref:hypothetical protein n=1 Tax=Parasphingorhabdus sp. TaxID=2709688 RepID=UPI003D2C5468